MARGDAAVSTGEVMIVDGDVSAGDSGLEVPADASEPSGQNAEPAVSASDAADVA